ncbi:hypothetical protein C2G38_2187825 [Gigaspora rosea]|uniref:GAE domain-containing protein n=1 Tax=Gigaspora rosea TaxID=44941 RepID=A0A397V8K3_9GLOM|nr:hypothetical protein C2G38_2187825 [Gigaspora rosea]
MNALDSLGLLGLGDARIPSQSSTTSTSLSTSTSTSTDKYVVYNKNGFKVGLNPSKNSNNSNSFNIEVTSIQKLQVQPPSLIGILPGATAQQTIHVTNPQKSNVRLRLRIVYSTPTGAKVDKIAEFNGFPQEFW